MAVQTPLCVLLGPTASGKSALALALAERWGGEILSVDSMQVYRGMDLGTAKPTAAEQRQARHWLIDVADPVESYTVARYVIDADAAIASARDRRVPLIATGGTPLYYKSLFEGLFDGPAADVATRERLNAEPLESLHSRLQQIDPAAAERIHRNDRKRLVRAIEVFELTGTPITRLQSEWSSGVRRHEARWFGLAWDREALNRRINARVKQMIDAGWLDETRTLLTRWGTLSQTAGEATGYAELIAHLQGRLSLGDAVEQIKIATRQLARRQMKWMRRWEQVHWLDGQQPIESLVAQVEASLASPPTPSVPPPV